MKRVSSCTRKMLQCLLLGTLFSLVFSLPAVAKEPTWQSSISSSVKLGVRDKFGSLNGYKASFKVSGKKETWTKQITVKADQFAYVSFPSDFTTYAPDDSYRWQCIVNGKPVLSGTIDYKTDSNGGITVKASEAAFKPAK